MPKRHSPFKVASFPGSSGGESGRGEWPGNEATFKDTLSHSPFEDTLSPVASLVYG